MAKTIDGILYGDVGNDGDLSYYNCEWCCYSCSGGNEVNIIIKADTHERECSLNPQNKNGEWQ